ncbi:aromatic ring-hydroxylating dioxygenase subunit alpha [Dokdonella sp.]|uniref:aromatic ring-hydroxylating oxygenase subunit alpha n=1 Tax=Dokdonella sp. TaxID=2291710 RepID=UPI0025C38AC2|nr:aromatic ring-hydroxylating dioxygenase subunit alpha [Dokdonella sp.]MBX3692838.1 aromatic ring-hydroxylating dioxygenase subunit alpha [Dokdonella sp.]
MKPRTSFGQKTLGRGYFTSKDIFDMERERIFRTGWLLVGHVSQLDVPGRFFVFDLDHESVIVLRDEDGAIRAFHNHCRHRGSRLCAAGEGNLGRSIRCPYHAWNYGLDGRLRSAPSMADVAGFDAADWPLHTVVVETWLGFVFISLAREPQPFAHVLANLTGRFAHRDTSVLRAVHREVYLVAANWKLVFHNFSECYHCPGVHPQLNRLTPFRNTENDLDEGAVLGGPMWMNNPEGSMTMGGERCAAPLPGISSEERGRVYYYTVFPSAFISFHPDYVLLHRAEALAIDCTRVTCEWYFHPDAIATPGFDPQPAIAFWDLTNRQDWTLCENTQRGVASLTWQPGPYSELESQLAAFDREYRRVMALDAASGD